MGTVCSTNNQSQNRQPKLNTNIKRKLRQNQKRERLRQKFGDKIKIKDDPMNKLLYYDAKIDGKRYKTMARYNKCTKEHALTNITAKQQKLIDELTIQWE